MFGQRTLFSFIKRLFQQNHELYFMYSITMQFLMIVETLSSIEIDVIAAKKHVFLNFIEKYLRLKWKKNVNLLNYHYGMSEYPWIYSNKHDGKLWIWQVSQCVGIMQHSDYAKICFDRILTVSTNGMGGNNITEQF